VTEKKLPTIDPSLLRGMTQRRISRRELFRGAGAVGVSAVLAACGVGGGNQANVNPNVGTEAWWAKQKKTGEVDFANWAYYIDVSHGKYPSLELFEKDTGISVNYRTVITENAPFLARIRPDLQAGNDPGWDIIVITNGTYFDELVRNQWVTPLDQSRMTNFYKYAGPRVKDPFYDPGNKYSMAWQSFYTGIGYDPDKTGREITSFMDLFDPKFKGKVGLFGDTQDLPNLTLAGLGIKPETSTESDWRKAADFLIKQRDSGQIRQFYEQGYIDALANNDIWISMAWNGDIVIVNGEQGTNLKFAVPEEGAMLATDNMLIPAHAAHPLDAMILMDYVYRPDIQALITDYNAYQSPVPATRDIILHKLHDPAIANDPLVFPTQDLLSRLHSYRVLTQDELKTWNDIFLPVYQG
jgi:spermidine/putrescine transport system substrate-binding protein